MNNKNKIKQLKRIRKVVVNLSKNNKFVDKDLILNSVKSQDVNVCKELIEETKNINVETKMDELTNKINKLDKQLIINEAENMFNKTPYSILGITEDEYTKEELLNIVGNKINILKESKYDNITKELKINEILDAYNEIIKFKGFSK